MVDIDAVCGWVDEMMMIGGEAFGIWTDQQQVEGVDRLCVVAAFGPVVLRVPLHPRNPVMSGSILHYPPPKPSQRHVLLFFVDSPSVFERSTPGQLGQNGTKTGTARTSSSSALAFSSSSSSNTSSPPLRLSMAPSLLCRRRSLSSTLLLNFSLHINASVGVVPSANSSEGADARYFVWLGR